MLQLLKEEKEMKGYPWREVTVWKKLDIRPDEAERRIRECVRPWLQQARALHEDEWWATKDIHTIGDFVDEWFGEETQVRAAAETMTSETDRQNNDTRDKAARPLTPPSP